MGLRLLLRLAVCAYLLFAASLAHAQLYWRVEVGASYSTSGEIHDRNFAPNHRICGNAACTTAGGINDLGGSAVLGGGVGWRLNPNLRVDATVAYHPLYKLKNTMP